MKRQLFVPPDQVAATLIVMTLKYHHIMFFCDFFFQDVQKKEAFMKKSSIHTAKSKALVREKLHNLPSL